MLSYEEKLQLAENVRKNGAKKSVPEDQLALLETMKVSKMDVPTRHGNVGIYLIKEPSISRKGLLINIHGGGFCKPHTIGDNAFSSSMSKYTGVPVIDIDYTVAPEAAWPIAYQQCYDVIMWAIQHQAELDIQPDPIFIAGHSAGGNLGIAVAFEAEQTKEFTIQELFLDYPALDLYTPLSQKEGHELSHISEETAAAYNTLYVNSEEDLANPYVSPALADDQFYRNFPATTFMLAQIDALCAEGVQLANRLAKLGRLVTIKVFEGSKHGFVTAYLDEHWKEAHQMMIQRILSYYLEKLPE